MYFNSLEFSSSQLEDIRIRSELENETTCSGEHCMFLPKFYDDIYFRCNEINLLLLGTQVKETGLEDKEGDGLERACDTLIMCIITTLNHGLRNGGGIGDILRKPATSVN